MINSDNISSQMPHVEVMERKSCFEIWSFDLMPYVMVTHSCMRPYMPPTTDA